jgi:hypothetical protein
MRNSWKYRPMLAADRRPMLVRLLADARPDRTSNRDFAASDPQFRAACERAGVSPTRRQASRWRRKRGSAWALRNEAPAA